MPPKKKEAKDSAEEEKLTRIAIVSPEKCKPKKCRQECKKSCPVVKMGKLCIEVGPKSKVAFISEPLCIGMFRHNYFEVHDIVHVKVRLFHYLHCFLSWIPFSFLFKDVVSV